MNGKTREVIAILTAEETEMIEVFQKGTDAILTAMEKFHKFVGDRVTDNNSSGLNKRIYLAAHGKMEESFRDLQNCLLSSVVGRVSSIEELQKTYEYVGIDNGELYGEI